MRRRIFAAAAGALLVAALALVPAPASGGSTFVPEVGTDPASIDLERVAGARRLPDGSLAVPVRAREPEWLTPDLKALVAQGDPVPAPAAAVPASSPFDVPVSGFAGIGPGSFMVSPAGCTMNFVFGSPGRYSIGTAGHCVDKVGQRVTLLTVGPGRSPTGWVLVDVGSVKKRVDNGIGADFALVSIDADYQSWVRSTIPQVLGPCGGAYDGQGLTSNQLPIRGHETVRAGEQIFHYGHGLVIGTGGTARTGHALYWDTKAVWWAGTIMFGDSGSAARVGTTSLQAAGDVTHLLFDGKRFGVTAAGTRATELERLAGDRIVNSSLCPIDS